MRGRKRAAALLEVLVSLTILMIVAATVTLSALAPPPKNEERTTLQSCATTAIRERRIVTVPRETDFIACHPDGRIRVGQRNYLTFSSDL